MRFLTEWEGGSPEERALLAQCREAVGRMLPNAEVILYGSRARLQLPGLELVRVSCHAIYPAGRAGRYRLMTPETRMLVQYRFDRHAKPLQKPSCSSTAAMPTQGSIASTMPVSMPGPPCS